MEGSGLQVLSGVQHIKFLIFDWSVPNLVMGAIIVLVFFAAALVVVLALASLKTAVDLLSGESAL